MKFIRQIIPAIIMLMVVLFVSGCAKRATKEQALEQRNKLAAWYESDDFKKLIIPFFNEDGSLKDEAGLDKAVKVAESKKIDEIIIALGFKNQEEFKATDDVLNSPEVKAADKMLEERVKTAVIKITTELAAKKAEEIQKTAVPAN
jgi:hypothetical protein